MSGGQMTRIPMLKPRVPTLDVRRVKPPPKTVDPWYLTPEHKATHYPGQRLFADHKLERRDRPDLALDPANGWALCGSAHSRKTAEERAKRLKAPPTS